VVLLGRVVLLVTATPLVGLTVVTLAALVGAAAVTATTLEFLVGLRLLIVGTSNLGRGDHTRDSARTAVVLAVMATTTTLGTQGEGTRKRIRRGNGECSSQCSCRHCVCF